jgi:5-methylcytosine-specific restriction enzyme subunit McrC
VDHLLYISEQYESRPLEPLSPYLKSVLISEEYKKQFYHKPDMACFHLQQDKEGYKADTNYFVGVDWLVPGKAAVYVESKLNDKEQVDYLSILLQSLEAPENLDHLDGLFHIDYDSPWIQIPEQQDKLSPILIAQFLKLVQHIVRKGLKKSYYRITENLNNRVKGKILVGQQIKHNIVKNKLTKTICNYQVFGMDTEENQFLKLVLEFVPSYISQKEHFFNTKQVEQLRHILSYCVPAFEHVGAFSEKHKRIHVKKNPFYKEYEEAIKVGGYILKRFSFNINKDSKGHTSTPPFWIDMSKLFELYIFNKLKKVFPGSLEVTYHDNFKGGKQTDILVRAKDFKCVIDCKYKPRYRDEDPTLDDKRQLAGYTRMKRVYDHLEIPYNAIVKGLIIYPSQDGGEKIGQENFFRTKIHEYIDFYKLGIKLPYINLSRSKA